MKLAEFLLAEFDGEVERSRRALEQVPEGKYDWKPHEKSMMFGYLANMVATIPSWIAMTITKDELDVAPADGSKMEQKRMDTSDEFLQALDKSAADARAAFAEDDRGASHDILAVTRSGTGCDGVAALQDDPGRD